MGRLAGTSPANEAARKEIQRKNEHERRRIAAMTPVVHPPAARRQMALLWYIGQDPEIGLIIGRRGHAPLTADMRVLLRKKLIVMTRIPVYEARTLPLCNYLMITPAGTASLTGARMRDADKHYIEMAMKTGVVR